MDGVVGSSIVDSGVPPMNLQQQQKLIMDYLAAMNAGGSGGSVETTTGQDFQEMMAANSQLMEGLMSGDMFANLLNSSALAAPQPQYSNYMPMMNSTFHKEFLKQIANVQKEQGVGAIAAPIKRPVGRPPGNGNGLASTRTPQKPRDSTSGGSPRFACDYCHKTFASRYYLATHIQVHLSQLSPEERKEQMRVIRSPEQLRLLERAEERQRFLAGHKPQQGNGMVVVKQEPVAKYNCGKCVASFMDEEEFKQHFAVHTADRPVFNCQKCHKSYKYEGAFESHRCQGKGEFDYYFREKHVAKTVDLMTNRVDMRSFKTSFIITVNYSIFLFIIE